MKNLVFFCSPYYQTMYFVPRSVRRITGYHIYGVLGPRSLDPTVNRWLLPHGMQGDP